MNFTNAQILSAVLCKWAQPIINELLAGKMNTIPFVQAIQNKVVSTGLVGQGWTLAKEIMPFSEPIVNSIVPRLLNNYLANIPDDAIPALIHGIVNKAMENGALSILDGKIMFDINDLTRLKTLLDNNLPLVEQSINYQIKE